MKKTFVLAVAALVILLAYSPIKFSKQEITNFPSRNSGVVAFGDSLVEGVGSSNGGGFVKILNDELRKPITNLGRSGDTTAKALERIDVVLQKKPAVTILLLGGNDYLQHVPRQETIDNLQEIIKGIHESGSVVLLVGIESEKIGFNDREVFDNLAHEYKTAYVPDILDGILGNRALMADTLHPNDDGYKVIAEKIKKVLFPLIIRQ